MVSVVNRDVRIEREGEGNVVLKITPHDQEGRDAKPAVIEVKYSTAINLTSALAYFVHMEVKEAEHA